MTDRPWIASYGTGVPADIAPQTESLAEPLLAAGEQYADKVALDYFGATTTYRELVAQVRRAAGALQAAGLRPGDRFAIALPNCPQHVVAFYAAQLLGAIAVEINPTFTRDEIAHELTEAGVTMVLCWQRLLGTMTEAAAGTEVATIFSADLAATLPLHQRLALRLPVPRARAMRDQLRGPHVPGIDSWESVVRRGTPLPADHELPSADKTAALLFTSGTSGTPRAAKLSHRNLLSVSAMGEAWVTQLQPGREVFVAALPFFHSFGMQLCMLFGIRMGARIHVIPTFDTGRVLAAQRRVPITFFPGVPAMFERLTTAARATNASLTSIRVAISGAMALPAATAQAWEELTGGIIVEGYGMTETAPIVLGNPVDRSRRPGWAGLPFPSTEIKIVDLDDPTKRVAEGEIGELVVRGPQVTDGYWNRPAETAACQLEGNWWRTGDIVQMDAAGFVKMVDRSKEIIITGGYNVYPSQVEDLVRQMPQVADVAVVGLPAEGAMGERVVAAIVLKAGEMRVDVEQVTQWCHDRLARYAWPRAVVVLEELPRSQIGKVLRRVVRDELMGQLPAAAAS